MTLIVEDPLWLLLDDESGDLLIDCVGLSRALAGAVQLELTQPTPAAPNPPLRLTGPGETVKFGRLVLSDAHLSADRLNDQVLTASIELLRRRPVPVTQAITQLERGLIKIILERLCANGRVRRESLRLLGIIPMTYWPTLDRAGKNQLRGPLRRTLLDAHEPDSRTAALIALLHIVDGLTAQCPGWRRSVIHGAAQQISHRFFDRVRAVEAVKAAVCDSHANSYTGSFLSRERTRPTPYLKEVSPECNT